MIVASFVFACFLVSPDSQPCLVVRSPPFGEAAMAIDAFTQALSRSEWSDPAPRASGSASSSGKTSTAAPLGNPDVAETPEQELSFDDVLDIINPLQHIPLVNIAYREITGDEIKPFPRIAGGALFGGALGAAGALVNVLVEIESGKDIGENALALLTGEDESLPNSGASGGLAAGDTTNPPPATTLSLAAGFASFDQPHRISSLPATTPSSSRSSPPPAAAHPNPSPPPHTPPPPTTARLPEAISSTTPLLPAQTPAVSPRVPQAHVAQAPAPTESRQGQNIPRKTSPRPSAALGLIPSSPILPPVTTPAQTATSPSSPPSPSALPRPTATDVVNGHQPVPPPMVAEMMRRNLEKYQRSLVGVSGISPKRLPGL